MPELELGLGYEPGTNGGWQRDWLYWYDPQGDRYLTNEEIAQQERERRQLAEERLAELEARLKTLENP